MTLDDAIKQFEARFQSVTSGDRQLGDKELPVVWSGGVRTWAETSAALYASQETAILEWLRAAEDMLTGLKFPATLNWALKPELLEFQITIADRQGRHRQVNNRFAVKSQFTTATV